MLVYREWLKVIFKYNLYFVIFVFVLKKGIFKKWYGIVFFIVFC